MKVGIYTIYGGANYGNVLQNYALQQFLLGQGIASETIRFTAKFDKSMKGLEKVKILMHKYFHGGVLDSLWRIRYLVNKKINRKEIRRLCNVRTQQFDRFRKENLQLSKAIYTDEAELAKCNGEYQYVIAGSDQIWNPYWQGKLDSFFLNFVPREKRIAYAPSIGVSKIPEDQRERYIRLINGFDRLSCREPAGAELISEMTKRECIDVVDPVFLLDRDHWRRFITPKKEQNYVLTYFLGGKSYETAKRIRQYAVDHDLKIIDIFDPETINSAYASVEGFISLIANADMFFTDSFHGCAFSILLQTQFVVCARYSASAQEKMDSRMVSLMAKLDIRARNLTDLDKGLGLLDFTRIFAHLDPWVTQSRAFLMEQLLGNGNPKETHAGYVN